MKVEFLEAAEVDLARAVRHYRDEAGDRTALRLRLEVERVVRLLATTPLIGKPTRGAARSFGLRRFPYKLVYRHAADRLLVVALAHDRRRPDYWAGRS